ncbi:MAG TPA: potassium channel protein [Gemmatimonadaceae bacterium]|nr:potassium channel protein [Gemmatimonadaceae bacterium]
MATLVPHGSTAPLPLIRFVVIGLLLTAVGTAGYIVLEHWPPLDAFYMTVITLSTVGYGEVHTLTPAGRSFTIALIVGGLATLGYFATSVTQYVTSGVLTGDFRRRRMQHLIDAMSDHYIVCGYGRVGHEITAELHRRKRQAVLVDRDPERFDAHNGQTPYVVGDASDDDVLRRVGIERARGLVVTTSDDADNLFVTVSARALNPSATIVARCNQSSSESKLMHGGASSIVSPLVIGGQYMATHLVYPNVSEFMNLMARPEEHDAWVEEVTVEPGSTLIGRPIGEGVSRAGSGVTVIAVRQSTATRVAPNPHPDVVLAPGDVLIALGNRADLARLAERAAGPESHK